MTHSIVPLDPTTGDLGVAMQSKFAPGWIDARVLAILRGRAATGG